MDAYVEFILNRIEEYRKDIVENIEEKENNNVVIGELVQALAFYEKCIGGIK
ncbi:hypothetical protein [Clostridium beijerinckii]|uniref:Uncharacterized protein n=1 Tax=Clostridium beijerinckii TaxID=1520 RepID=A0AAX0BAJ0_CLOBE|nr:hypothetical protein [Clostridium beijerinckii]NRT92260.1 hypothetical protein [Clostridium beijerinckii]NYC75597.1 hypothetical protein [Clostridium beijerinckii]